MKVFPEPGTGRENRFSEPECAFPGNSIFRKGQTPFCHSDEGGIGPALARKPGVSRAANAGFLLRRNDKAKQYLFKRQNPPVLAFGVLWYGVRKSREFKG